MDNEKIRSKPKDIGYEPALYQFRKTIEEIELSDGESPDIELLQKLFEYKNKGYEIFFNCGHDQNYHYHDDYASCETWIEINIYQNDHEAYEKAKESYKNRLKKYKKDYAAWEEYEKQKKEAEAAKLEKEAKKNRYQQFLALKHEFGEK